jgi:L-threonylcarbamoyladenylate synthase
MSTSDEIDAAVAALRRGELVAMPTETVYGLAADACNPAAIARIFATKGRPADHPLIVHLADARALDDWSRDIPAAARVLADQFWPGPLTLILRRQPQVSDALTGGQDTVGLRVPAHPVAHALIQRFGGALAAPSANRFGRISPTTAAHVRAEFGDAVPHVLDGGASSVGLESTIVDLSQEPARILRPGSILRSEIEAWIGPLADAAHADTPRVSGSLAAHYAPSKPLILLDEITVDNERGGAAAGALWLGLSALPAGVEGIALGSDPKAYAHDLYAALRELDAGPGTRILVVMPPRGEAWAAIHDRLQRAAAGSGVDADDAP